MKWYWFPAPFGKYGLRIKGPNQQDPRISLPSRLWKEECSRPKNAEDPIGACDLDGRIQVKKGKV
jgi:hypothetical protein